MGKIVNMHEAKTHFSSLAARVANGEEVIIARAGEPIMKLVKFTNNRPPIGAYAHEWEGVDIEELLKPWTDEEIQSWIDGPI
jgi:antitoxin (DNA-binding transcriptional repressor) of toxin-antitoxin stability system